MRIRRLKLSGFKSFVEPASLSIEPGLTGVVGPNGCGKSNLLEAIRWVMGEGSPKSLRGGGMEDVIFAGTATRPPRGMRWLPTVSSEKCRKIVGTGGIIMAIPKWEKTKHPANGAVLSIVQVDLTLNFLAYHLARRS